MQANDLRGDVARSVNMGMSVLSRMHIILEVFVGFR